VGAAKPCEKPTGLEDDEEVFEEVGVVTLRLDWAMPRCKAALAELPGLNLPQDCLRIRDKLSLKLGTVWRDDATVGANSKGEREGKEIVCVACRAGETFSSQHLLLGLQQWLPGEARLAAKEEVAVPSAFSIAQLKAHIAGLYALPEAEVRVVKPRAFELKDLAKIPQLDWFGLSLDDAAGVRQKPWSCRDGDVILFKDNRATTLRVRNDGRAAGTGQPAKPASKRVEDGGGIKFYTAEEAAERQAHAELVQKQAKERELAEREAARVRAAKAREELTEEEKQIEDLLQAERAQREAEVEQARQDAMERVAMAQAARKAQNPFLQQP